MMPTRQDLFNLDPTVTFFNSMLLTSHPKPVRDQIAEFEDILDRNPGCFWRDHFIAYDQRNMEWAARYMGCADSQIALVDSATVGLGVIYGGLTLEPGSEVIVSDHEHFSAVKAIEYAKRRGEWRVAPIDWYREGETPVLETMLDSLVDRISEETRVLALTWVHSSTGVKMPVREICQYIQALNKHRRRKILTIVDGVHAFGLENFSVTDLGCDIFVTSCHKWLFGPRGTGLIYVRESAEPFLQPVIATYNGIYHENWRSRMEKAAVPLAHQLSPGGFQSFSHKWSLFKAFEMHLELGKASIEKTTYDMTAYLKEGLVALPGVRLITPKDRRFSASLICVEVARRHPEELVDLLWKHRIVATVTPYYREYLRFSVAFYNTREECDRVVDVLRELI